MNRIKNRLSILLLVFVSTTFYSQKHSSFSFESGALHNRILKTDVPFDDCGNSRIYEYQGCFAYPYNPKQVVVVNDGDNSYTYGREYSFYNTTSYFLKVAYQKELIIRRNFSFSLPMGISYLNKIDKYSIHEWNRNYDVKTTYEKSIGFVNLSLGVMTKYIHGAFHVDGTINYNLAFAISSKMKSEYNGNEIVLWNYRSTNLHHRSNFTGMLSTKISAGYNLTKSISVGPTLELFYTSIRNIRNKLTGSDYTNYPFYDNYTNYIFGLNGNNIWINPGLKLQIDL